MEGPLAGWPGHGPRGAGDTESDTTPADSESEGPSPSGGTLHACLSIPRPATADRHCRAPPHGESAVEGDAHVASPRRGPKGAPQARLQAPRDPNSPSGHPTRLLPA
jgi:hypothetical protein